MDDYYLGGKGVRKDIKWLSDTMSDSVILKLLSDSTVQCEM